MLLFLQVLAMIINGIIFYKVIDGLTKRFKVIHVTLLIFQAIFVVPILLEIVLGIQQLRQKSVGFDAALNDNMTNIIYSLFTITIPLFFYYISRHMKGMTFKEIKSTVKQNKINIKYQIILAILMFIPVIAVIFSPDPTKYIFHYAYFQRNADLANVDALKYHKTVIGNIGTITTIAIISFRYFGTNKKINTTLVILAMSLAAIINGKRTLLAFIILGVLLVDIIKDNYGKLPFKKIFLSITTIFSIFIGYAFLIGKHTKNVSTIDNLRLYFFRDIDVKFAIYSLLNPEQYRILDYTGQSYLFNALFFIPRKLWGNKPYPYDVYVTNSSLGLPSDEVLSWSFQTSNFGEALANFNFWGLIILLALIYVFIKLSELTKSPFILVLSLFTLTRAFMNHYVTYVEYLFFWGICVLTILFTKKFGNTIILKER